ncbi:MAG TPA: PepSY-associated TM helix domain-containing protein [Gammaproteobacteria bacterium]
MWSKLPPRFVARMLSGHTVVGLAASALLYVLCLSGTAMVFHEEFARWEQPGVPEFSEVAPESVSVLATNALARVEQPHHFDIALPIESMPRMSVTADEASWYANADGELLAQVSHPWTEFLTKLHYYLTLPSFFGLTLVGILGMLMTALVISGVLAHPKLFRDAFKLRRKGTERLRETDTHNRLGVWAAPFHLIVAFTGAALGLASLVAVVLSPAYLDGNIETFYAPIFGEETEGDKTAAPLADIDTALHNFDAEYPGLVPWYVSFHDPATAGQSAHILAQHPRRLIFGDYYPFNAEGELTGNTGLSDGPVGQQIAGALYPLHFGSFGGLWVKFAYGVLGILACVMVVSGVNIWLLKRRQRGRAVPALERAWAATAWGTPAAMVLVLLIAVAGVAQIGWLVGIFWAALLLGIAVAIILPRLPAAFAFRTASGVLLLAALIVHAVQNATVFHSPAAWGVSISLLLVAAWLLRGSFRRRQREEESLVASRA